MLPGAAVGGVRASAAAHRPHQPIHGRRHRQRITIDSRYNTAGSTGLLGLTHSITQCPSSLLELSKSRLYIDSSIDSSCFQPVCTKDTNLGRISTRLDGATENARHENTGRSKMQGWKVRDMKMRDQIAGVETAGKVSMESQSVKKCLKVVVFVCRVILSV